MPDEPNPYVPSRLSSAESEEEVMARKAREPVRNAVFAGLLLVVGVTPALIVGGWAGLIVGFLGATALWWIYRLTTRTPKGINPAITAGKTACPSCGSMQTDQTWLRGPGSGQVLVWTCFACDHRWNAQPPA
jgi:hypothetical protein